MSLFLTKIKAFSFSYCRRSCSRLRVKNASSLSKHTAADDNIHQHRYQLYQYKICPFCNIVKTFLNYQKIPFQSVEVNPLTKSELEFSSGYRKVPILRIIDVASTTPNATAFRQLNGTEEILSNEYYLSNINNECCNDNYDDDFASSDSSTRWQQFGIQKLAPLLYPNLCRTLSDSFRAFNYVHDDSNFSIVERYSIQYIGSVAMYFAASKIKQKYKINDVQIALDEALEELESELSSAGRQQFSDNERQYLFLQQITFPSPSSLSSQNPHLGDLVVFGVLKGLEGLPLWNEIFNNPKFLNIRQWYTDVDEVLKSRKAQTSRYGYND